VKSKQHNTPSEIMTEGSKGLEKETREYSRAFAAPKTATLTCHA